MAKINLLNSDYESLTRQIRQCRQTLSSSLHGLIVSHAYGIPSQWIRYSDKLTGDNVKFEDYFLSVGLSPYTGAMLQGDERVSELQQMIDPEIHCPDSGHIKTLQEQLLQAFPSQ